MNEPTKEGIAIQPNQEQLKKFWEGYGLKQDSFGNISVPQPEHTTYEWLETQDYPALTLDNLNKYAIQELKKRISLHHIVFFEDGTVEINYFTKTGNKVQDNYMQTATGKDPDPALALFWALDKVREETK